MDNRRHFKPTIPAIIMGNVNTLQNKMDELSALNNLQIYQEGSMYLFMEPRLTHLVPDAKMELPGFTTVRTDTKGSLTLTNVGVTQGMFL